MEVWSGAIATKSIDNLQGIRFLDTSSTKQCGLTKHAKLSVKTFVNPTLVPLYLQSGPNLEVHIANTETEAWFKDRLLAHVQPDLRRNDEESDDDDNGGELPIIQCPVGVLLDVQESSKNTNRRTPAESVSSWDKVTHILIYGILMRQQSVQHSPDNTTADVQNFTVDRKLSIYAVSICSGREAKVEALPSPPQSPQTDEGTAYFLPDMQSPSPKRKRVATLFENAAEFHEKARRGGGVRLSAPGKKDGYQYFTEAPFMKIKRERENARSPPVGIESQNGLNGAASTTKLPGLSRSTTLQNSSSRIQSLRGRSKSIGSRQEMTPASLFKVRMDLSQATSSSSASARYSPATSPGETIATNKDLLTRTILTSMRLYGYHRKSRGAARPETPALAQSNSSFPRVEAEALSCGDGLEQPVSAAGSGSGSLDADDDEEFKTMYHSTYRASTFALRRFLRAGSQVTSVTMQDTPPDPDQPPDRSSVCVPVLDREKAVNVVDSVLKLFCET